MQRSNRKSFCKVCKVRVIMVFVLLAVCSSASLPVYAHNDTVVLPQQENTKIYLPFVWKNPYANNPGQPTTTAVSTAVATKTPVSNTAVTPLPTTQVPTMATTPLPTTQVPTMATTPLPTTQVPTVATPTSTVGTPTPTSTVSVPTPTSTVVTPVPDSAKWVSAYYDVKLADQLPIDQIDWSTLTHLVVSRIRPNYDGSVITTFDLSSADGPVIAKNLALQAHANQRKALLRLGGLGDRWLFSYAANAENRALFVQNLVNTLNSLGYDGLDLDWQPIYEEDQPVLLALIADLRVAKPGIIITVPVTWVNSNIAYTIGEFYADLANDVDQMNIMSYGMISTQTGWYSWHSSALLGEAVNHPTSLNSSVKRYLELGVPAAKLGVGTGFFGQCWQGVSAPRAAISPSNLVNSDLAYAEIAQAYAPLMNRSFDNKAKAPYLSAATPVGSQGCSYISYEDAESIALKGDYVHLNGLGGTTVWSMNQGFLADAPAGERDPLMQVVKEAFIENTITPTPVVTPDPSTESGKWVMGYYMPYQREMLPPDEIDWMAITHLMVGPVYVKPNGTLDTSFAITEEQGPPFARDLAQRAHANQRKAILMIGGEGEQNNFLAAASDANRASFVANLLSTMDSLGYDGLDIDWEMLEYSADPELSKTLFIKLVRDLREARPNLLLSAPVEFANKNYSQAHYAHYAQIAQYVDHLNIMSYIMAGPYTGWDVWHSGALYGETGTHPTSVNDSVNRYLSLGTPAEKIGIGIGFFGQCWQGALQPGDPVTSESKIVANDNDISFFNIRTIYEPLAPRTFDDTAKVPYLSSATRFGPKACNFISYEDEASVAAKGAYIHEKGVGGLIIWTVNQGHFSDNPIGSRDPLLNVIKYTVIKGNGTSLPTSTATVTPATPTPTSTVGTSTPVVPTPTSIVGTSTPTPATPTATVGPESGKWVMGYYVGYQRDLMPPSEIDWTSLTHLVVGPINVQDDGTLNTDLAINSIEGPALARQLAQLAHANGRKALLMLGGEGAQNHYLNAASDATRATFVQNILSTMDSLGYDGIDLDWEMFDFSSDPTLSKQLFVKLVKDLRAARPNLLLTVPVEFANMNYSQGHYAHYGEIAPYVDQMNIMTYVMSGNYVGWSVWHSSPLTGESGTHPTSVSNSVARYRSLGIPDAKLGVGVGFFGQCWRNVQEPRVMINAGSSITQVANDNYMSFYNIRTQYQPYATRIFDNAAQVPYLSSATQVGPQGCNYISYEDEESVALKGQFVQQQGLGGLIIWTINQGHFSSAPADQRDPLLKVIKQTVLNDN
jgi:chitinase